MEIKVLLQPRKDGGFVAYAPALPGFIGEGSTADEALRKINEAMKLRAAGEAPAWRTDPAEVNGVWSPEAKPGFRPR